MVQSSTTGLLCLLSLDGAPETSATTNVQWSTAGALCPPNKQNNGDTNTGAPPENKTEDTKWASSKVFSAFLKAE